MISVPKKGLRMKVPAHKVLKINTSRSISPKAWGQLMILHQKRIRAKGDKKLKYIYEINKLLVHEGLISHVRGKEDMIYSHMTSPPKKASI